MDKKKNASESRVVWGGKKMIYRKTLVETAFNVEQVK